MSFLTHVDNVFHRDFKTAKTQLSEKQTNMNIKIIGDGCNLLCYSLDKELNPNEYKGGVFPFFEKVVGAHTVCDYLLFAETKGKQYILLIELKKGKQSTFTQLNAAECFVNYFICSINRINKTSYNPTIRRISIHEYKLSKKTTKIKDNEYDEFNHCILKQNFLHLLSYLK